MSGARAMPKAGGDVALRARIVEAAERIDAWSRQRWIGRRARTVYRVLPAATAIVGVIFVVGGAIIAFKGGDPYAYWTYRLDADPYAAPANSWGSISLSHQYPPVFAQVIGPLQLLPYPAFHAVWTLIAYSALIAIVGIRWAGLAVLVVPGLAFEMGAPNVTMLLGLAAVFGRRVPALWAIPLLTKVTPGVGVLWFVVRREWRGLAVAVGVAGVLAAISFLTASRSWEDWIAWLWAQHLPVLSDVPGLWVPVWPRMTLAAALVIVAGATTRPWLLPLAMWAAMPVPWNQVFWMASALSIRLWWLAGRT